MPLSAPYLALKALVRRGDLSNPEVGKAISEMVVTAHPELMRCDEVALRSEVPGKTYFAFRDGERISRPINQDLFISDPAVLRERFDDFFKDRLGSLGPDEATRTIYTLAMSFCALYDTKKTGDKKTPATYFEILIGHLFAAHLGVNPTNAVKIVDTGVKLPTDFIFDLGGTNPKLHVPIKTSTRERVIQAWAHQRILDGVFGADQYRGILVCLAETLMKVKKLSVVEVCLPDQWRVYQRFLAKMTRVYYLDVPDKYRLLATGTPRIDVKPLGYFFTEAAALTV